MSDIVRLKSIDYHIISLIKVSMKYAKLEPCLFGCMVVITLFPVFGNDFFPTGDGPAHLYNANLINHLLTGEESVISLFFQFNNTLVPNWFSHFIMALLLNVLPGDITEKVFVISYLVLLPISFRYMLKQFNAHHLAYLIFPFCYSFSFCIGLFNFTYALIWMFFTLGYLKRWEVKLKIRQLFILMVLLLILWFSHLMIFMITLMIMGMMIVRLYISSDNQPRDNSQGWKSFLSTALKLLLSAIPALLLTIHYLAKTTISGSYVRLSLSELIYMLYVIQPVAPYGRGQEPYGTALLFVFGSFLIIILLWKLWKIKRNTYFPINREMVIQSLSHPATPFWLTSAILLLMYFIVPDGYNAGMMSKRLLFLFFIFFIASLALIRMPKLLGVVGVIGVLIVHILLLRENYLNIKGISTNAREIYTTGNYIKPAGVVIWRNQSNHWLEGNFGNYLGLDKPVVLMKNYEAAVDWFPLRWNDEEMADVRFGNLSASDCAFSWQPGFFGPTQMADYICVYGTEKPLSEPEINALNSYYTLIYTSENTFAKLYCLKEQDSVAR